MACSLAAVKVGCSGPSGTLRTPRSFCRPLVAHLEAGLRSFDRTMPEEINRVVTDSVADLLWTPSEDADQNLLREGIAREKIERVGNIMIDSLEMMRAKIEQQNTLRRYGLQKDGFGLVTLHRPSNVDSPDSLKALCDALLHIAGKLPLIFPVHPRTRKNLERFGLLAELKKASGLYLDQPISYVPFMNLVFNCRLAITDSGGIQEETTYLGIPCLTLRPNTERPVTITQGTNRLCSIDTLSNHVEAALNSKSFKAGVPRLWDGQTAGRIVISIEKALTEFAKNESLRTIRRQVNCEPGESTLKYFF
jgi:UDP-N-acetylglucosamine 2-epimerase (non-hydrolysing)